MVFGTEEEFARLCDLKPLCVDLDGTLLQGDSTALAFFETVKTNPFRLFLVPIWLLRGGKYLFKQKLMQYTDIDAATLPYRHKMVEWLKSEREKGRELVLATASMQNSADKVAAHLRIFDRAVGSDNGQNLRSCNKRDFLIKLSGENGYDYAGNSAADLKVWAAARKMIFAGNKQRVLRKLQKSGKPIKVF